MEACYSSWREPHSLWTDRAKRYNPLMLGYVVKFRAEKENVIPQLSQADTQDKVLSIYVYNRRLE